MNETSLRRARPGLMRPGLAFGFDLASLARRRGRSWDLTVVEAAQVTPRMRSVSFTGADLAELDWRPGQDLVLNLPQADGGLARRHYTIRDFNPAALRLDIDFVLHGDTPGGCWALGAQPGPATGAARSRHLGRGHRPCNGRGGTPLRQRAGCPRYGCECHSILPNSNSAAVCKSGQDARAPRLWIFAYHGDNLKA